MKYSNNNIIKYIIIFLFILIIFYLLNKYANNYYLEPYANINNKLLDNTDIYVINLDSDVDRWNNFIDYSNKINRISAYNGNYLDKESLIEDGILDGNAYMKKGQIGCALSHLKAWNESLKTDKQYLLVLEDDVILENNTFDKINELSKYIPEKWDILFLGGCNVYGEKYNERFLKPTRNDNTFNLCCHAMLINKKNIYKLINIMMPLKYPIDNQLRDNFDKIDVYYTYPNLINQNKEIISVRRVIDGLPQSEYWKNNHLNMEIV
jgi:glycosyl transferase family 25